MIDQLTEKKSIFTSTLTTATAMIIFDYDWNLLYGISHGNLYFPQAPSQAENT